MCQVPPDLAFLESTRSLVSQELPGIAGDGRHLSVLGAWAHEPSKSQLARLRAKAWCWWSRILLHFPSSTGKVSLCTGLLQPGWNYGANSNPSFLSSLMHLFLFMCHSGTVISHQESLDLVKLFSCMDGCLNWCFLKAMGARNSYTIIWLYSFILKFPK